MEHLYRQWSRLSVRMKRALSALLATFLAFSTPLTATATSTDLTELINTEAFQEIDDGDGSTDLELRFGATADRILRFDIPADAFAFLNDIRVYGDITASGALTINADDTGDATINFASPGTDQSITYNDSEDRFVFSSGGTFVGAISGSSLAASDLINCTVVTTNNLGQLACGSALTVAAGDERYVLSAGDTMTGDLLLKNSANLGVQGNITTSGSLKINDDDTGNATLSFGGPVVETITYSQANSQFEFSGSGRFVGDLTATGNLSGDTLTVSNSGVNIRGVQYYFPNLQGNSGQVLTNDGNGNLVWRTPDTSLADGSGSQLSLHPQYTNAVYEGTGSTTVGRLRLNRDNTNGENFYRWTTTRNTENRYDIVTRVRVPTNFENWLSGTGVELRFRTNQALTSQNSVQFKIFDTTDTVDFNSSQLVTANVWASSGATAADLNGTYTPGDYMTVRVTVEATSGDFADVSYLNFNWMVSTP